MGIQLKLLFSESKDSLNVVVEDYDKTTKKALRTMLDVMVDLRSKQNVSDIDDCSIDDLNSNLWNADSNDLETVLGGDLGIEISNITGNGVPLKVASSYDKSDSTLAAVVSMAEKCTLSDKEEEELLNADFSKIHVGKNITNPDDTNLMNEEHESESLIEATLLDEEAILSLTDSYENNHSEKTRNKLLTTFNCSKNEDPSIPALSSKNEQQSSPTNSKQKQQQTSKSAQNTEPSIPSTSGTSSRKNVRENSKSPKRIVTVESNSREGKSKHPESDQECEVIEEILDIDSLQEIDSWSAGNNSDGRIVVDLTNRENVDSLYVRTNSADVESCSGSDEIIVCNDFSDDDEVASQYSSARSGTRRRTESDAGIHSFVEYDVPFRRARSNPPEDYIETVHDDDDSDCEVTQVVDLTFDKSVECVDLTSDRNRRTDKGAARPIIIHRPTEEVMNGLRNYYDSNKDLIAAQKDALRNLSKTVDKKRSGIEAPPKLSNGLPYRKRCSAVTHESHIKFSRISSSPETPSLHRDLPRQTRGPAGFRLTDDLGRPKPVQLKEEEYDSRFSAAYQRGRAARQNFRGGRGGDRLHKFRPWSQKKRMFNRFNQNHISPLRRPNCSTRSSRYVQPSRFRGEVWLDLKK